MKRPTHHVHVKCSVKGGKPLDLDFFMDAKRRSKRGALTVHAYDIHINGQTIIAWQTSAHLKKESFQ